MKKNRRDSGQFWDRRSKVYDAQVIPEYKSAYKRTVKRSAHFLNKEDRVLEIGCGTGNATIPLAGCVKEITAIDTSREMMDRAKENSAPANSQTTAAATAMVMTTGTNTPETRSASLAMGALEEAASSLRQ